MRKVMKKIVASLATVAMAAGLFATMPAQEAKAATDEKIGAKTIYVVVPENSTYDYGINIWDGLDTKAEKTPLGWAKTMTKVQDGLYKISGDMYEKENPIGGGIQIMCWEFKDGKANNMGEWKTEKAEKDGKNTYWEAVVNALTAAGDGDVWLTVTEDWKVNTTTPVEIKKTPGEIVADTIDVALAKDVTLENKGAFDSALTDYEALTDTEKAKVDAAKVTKLKEAVAKVAKLKEEADKKQAEEDAKNAGKLTVYVKSPGWKKMNVYGWDGAEFGKWPGKELTPLKKNTGWFSVSFDISKATNLIFNDSKESGAEQTVDWKNVKAGTYWLVLSEKEDDGKYKVDKVSTTAPSDWKDEAAQEIENETTTAAPATTDKGDVVSKDEAAKFEKEAVVEGQPEGAALKVTEIAADSDVFKAVKEVAKTDLKNRTYVAVDFKLLKGTEAVQPNGDVKITMPVPEKLKNAKQVEVFRMGDDGKLVNLGKADVTDSKITFTTNHFSTYVFAEVKTATGTGDVAPIIALLAVAAVAGAMVVASRKKTVNE